LCARAPPAGGATDAVDYRAVWRASVSKEMNESATRKAVWSHLPLFDIQ
jgi:hypothetical protein